jgi:TrmH family RNA methyltransferase
VTAAAPARITSRDNPLLVRLRRLAHDAGGYRKAGMVWLDGEHLCAAAAQRGRPAAQAVVAESAWQAPALRELAAHADRVAIVPDALYAALSALPSPGGIGFALPLGEPPAIDPGAATVVLDRVQDAGNVGAILRSAGAFGFRQVIAIKGTAALWSPKVLRAGMGAHFGLRLIESAEPALLDRLAVPILATSSHHGEFLHRAALPWPCAWALGHEGQGVGDEVGARASLALRIAQPGGEESLNVASAAAICLHASATSKP